MSDVNLSIGPYAPSCLTFRPTQMDTLMSEIVSKFDEIDNLLRLNSTEHALSEIFKLRTQFGASIPEILKDYELIAPTVLIAGPARTATTWLRGALGKHPNVQVAHGEPNILFNISRGRIREVIDWYSNRENWKRFSTITSVYCDKSPSYICLSDNDISVLVSIFPNIKVIFGFRDQKERLWSVIHHRMRDFHFQGSWMDFCKSRPNEISHHIDAGRVEHHIHRWESLYNNSNILTVPFDLVRTSPETTINTVISFLDIQSISELPEHNKDKMKRRVLSKETKIILEDPPDDLMSIAESITKKSRYTNPPT